MKRAILIVAAIAALAGLAGNLFAADPHTTNTLSASSFLNLPVTNWATPKDVYFSQPVSCTYVYVWCISGEVWVDAPGAAPGINLGGVTNISASQWTRVAPTASTTNALKLPYTTVLPMKTTNAANNIVSFTFD